MRVPSYVNIGFKLLSLGCISFLFLYGGESKLLRNSIGILGLLMFFAVELARFFPARTPEQHQSEEKR